MNMRPSTICILALLAFLVWNLRALVVPVTAAVVPWVATQPAALLLLLLAALYWRVKHPTFRSR